MPVITAQNLSAYYENREIFSGLNFRINEGDYICVVGENGSGKTTLMRCILGFNVRHTGELELHGIERNQIGWLPQRSEAQKDFPASVKEVVCSAFAGGILSRETRAENRRRYDKNMKLLEIEGLENRPFSELSGGQQQRVLLCRALCAAKSVLLLDEPVTGLDAAARDELYRIIRTLNDSGMTVIMITHDLPRAIDEAQYVLHIAEKGGFFGSAEDYRRSGYKEGGQ